MFIELTANNSEKILVNLDNVNTIKLKKEIDDGYKGNSVIWFKGNVIEHVQETYDEIKKIIKIVQSGLGE